MEMWSPFASNYDNPILNSDPLGDEPDGCCKNFINNITDFIGGTISGIVIGTGDNLTGTNQRVEASKNFEGTGAAGYGWNTGLDIADIGGMLFGAGEAAVGGLGVIGSAAVTITTGGAATPITTATAAASIGLIVHGVYVFNNSYNNLVNQTGRVNASSSSSSGSNPGKRTQNRLPDKSDPNSTQTNKPGTTTKKYGPDGNVQKEFNKGHSKDSNPKGLKDHIHDYKPNPNNPTGRGTRMPPRTPKKNELKKDFRL